MGPTSAGYSIGMITMFTKNAQRVFMSFINYRHLLLLALITNLLFYRHLLVQTNLVIMLNVVYIKSLVIPPGVVFHAHFSACQEFIADVLQSLTPGRLALLFRLALAGF